jgi:hypothetical protein
MTDTRRGLVFGSTGLLIAEEVKSATGMLGAFRIGGGSACEEFVQGAELLNWVTTGHIGYAIRKA